MINLNHTYNTFDGKTIFQLAKEYPEAQALIMAQDDDEALFCFQSLTDAWAEKHGLNPVYVAIDAAAEDIAQLMEHTLALIASI